MQSLGAPPTTLFWHQPLHRNSIDDAETTAHSAAKGVASARHPAMDDDEPETFDWQEVAVSFPRIGWLLTRDGVRLRILWPGHYMARRSRTTGKTIYRRR